MRRFIAIPLKLFSLSRIAQLGALITTTTFILEAIVLFWTHQAHNDNPYLGIFIWNLIPGGIATGLAMIPVGQLLAARKLGGGRFSLLAIRRASADVDWTFAKRGLATVGALTLVNVSFFTAVGYEGYHYMDEPEFCGLVCHQVMEPEYEAYQRSPHAGVVCVECHIGPGVTPFVKAKLNGTKQMYGVFTGDYHRPIETPVHQLRRAEEICLECHDPTARRGNKVKVFEHYEEDRDNTLKYTILNLRLGGGEDLGYPSEGIHSHVREGRDIRFETLDEKQNDVVRVTMDDDEEGHRVWTRVGWDEREEEPEVEREMDCIDCHNRVGHYFLGAAEAMDERLAVGDIDSSIPFIKKEGMAAITTDYESEEEAHAAIADLATTYQDQYPDAWQAKEDEIRHAIDVLEGIWSASVWPEMEITWGTYESRHTHQDTDVGCFRCHNDEMVDQEGEPITSRCEACHYVLAEDDAAPEAFECLHKERSVDFF